MKMRFFLIAAATVLTAAAQETRSATRLTNDHYFDFERVSDAQISPDGAHIVYTRQQANKIEDRWESSHLDRQRRRQPEPVPSQGLRPALVIGRQAHAVYRRRRAARAADFRPMDRRRRPGHADHARHRQCRRRALVAGRKVDRVLHVRAGKRQLEHQHARGSARRQVDRRAAHRGYAALPPGSGRFPAGRAHASVCGFRRWRRGAADYQ